MLHDIILKNRSYRRFDASHPVEEKTLRGLVDLARLSPSGANLQPLKYIICSTAEKNALVYPHLRWAGYLKEWGGPVESERPTAYIVILGDTSIRKEFGCDYGIAAQSIMLGAVEQGLGGCMIASIQKDELRSALQIADTYEILLVLALGKPVEHVEIEPLGPDGSIRYWRDEQQVHHVPKRALDDLIV
ncbi:MAG: nitroreductase family protein [Anaerolineaceae bacterium]